jgi:hypothetical protein
LLLAAFVEMDCKLKIFKLFCKEYASLLKFSKILAPLQLILTHSFIFSKILKLMRKNGKKDNRLPQKPQRRQKAQKGESYVYRDSAPFCAFVFFVAFVVNFPLSLG